jgi:7-cyano-7-deazaguanine synthase in queuosine biosynthesis
MEDNSLVLVSASSGMDSSLTLAMLKYAGYKNIIACHFNYGHRGKEAERTAISTICQILNVPLKYFNIENLYSSIDVNSMLTDSNAKVTTATYQGLKQLDAWVPGRNMMFLTIMATLAESEVMKHNYDKVYLMGGFLNLTESGSYPDNSEYFLMTALEFFKYGTLIGQRIEPLFGLSNLMKSDQYALIKEFNLFNFFQHTISCDRPIVDNQGIPRNCINKDRIPACGSGLLSYLAGKMIGIDDTKVRKFYTVDDDTKVHQPNHLSQGQFNKDINQIISRIMFPPDRLEILKQNLEKIKK